MGYFIMAVANYTIHVWSDHCKNINILVYIIEEIPEIFGMVSKWKIFTRDIYRTFPMLPKLFISIPLHCTQRIILTLYSSEFCKGHLVTFILIISLSQKFHVLFYHF